MSHRKGNLADRFHPELRRRRGRRRGRAAPPDHQPQAASRRRASDRVPRPDRELRPDERTPHGLELDPARARGAVLHHENARARREPHPRHHARCRRRLRRQVHPLSRGGRDLGRQPHAGAAGEVDRGPARAFHGVDPGARPVLGRRDRLRRRRTSARRARRDDQRRRRLHLPGHQPRLQRLDQLPRPVRAAALQAGCLGGRDQQDADRAGARRGLSRRLLCDGARDRRHRARARHRPCHDPAPQPRAGERDPLRDADGGALDQRHRLRERRLPGLPRPRADQRRLQGLSRAAREGARRGPPARLRHRHRLERHRPRPVRIRDRARRPLRQGFGLHRRDGDGPGTEDDPGADHRRPARCRARTTSP